MCASRSSLGLWGLGLGWWAGDKLMLHVHESLSFIPSSTVKVTEMMNRTRQNLWETTDQFINDVGSGGLPTGEKKKQSYSHFVSSNEINFSKFLILKI